MDHQNAMHGRQISVPDLLTENLFKLPREVRDEIYAYALERSSPVQLAAPALDFIPPVLQQDPLLLDESIEAFYKVNHFIVLSSDPDLSDILADSTRAHVQPKDHIRRLAIHRNESFSVKITPHEYEEAHRTHPDRLRWETLYELPRLQELTISLDKRRDMSLFTLDFGPIVYDLRNRNPGFKFRFELSFDSVLVVCWNDPMWRDADDEHGEYQHMGYVDMSSLIEPPTDEDVSYVQEFLKDFWKSKTMPTNRSIKSGLLDEHPPQRRTLAAYYAVKEPPLLRCLMAEHYKIFKSYHE